MGSFQNYVALGVIFRQGSISPGGHFNKFHESRIKK